MSLSERVDEWLGSAAQAIQRSRFGQRTARDATRTLEREALSRLTKASAASPTRVAALVRALVRDWARLRAALESARQLISDLKRELDTARQQDGEEPLYPAVYLQEAPTARGVRAVVWYENEARALPPAPFRLLFGDIVWLNRTGTSIVGSATGSVPTPTHLATVDRVLPGNQLLVDLSWGRHVVRPAAALARTAVREGDVVSVNVGAGVAFGLMPRAEGHRLFLDHMPKETFADVGGLEREIDALTRVLWLHLRHAATAQLYGVPTIKSVLLVGPTGTGKSLCARAIANWFGQNSPSKKVRFIAVKPAQMHSKWWAESERLYRELFQTARETTEADPTTPVVIFFDEIDSIGLARGGDASDVADRVLTSLLAELDGFSPRGNVFVIAATNRRDALDPALVRPGRLGDLILEIPRPNRSAARSILGKHIPATTPLADPESRGPDIVRQQLIDAIVERMYPARAEGTAVATLFFANGTQRPVWAAEILGGANLASVARRALERACLREVTGGTSGLTETDVVDAANEELDTVAAGLTPSGCRLMLSDLPNGLEVAHVGRASGKSAVPVGPRQTVWTVADVGQS